MDAQTDRFDNLVDRNEIAHILRVCPTAVSNYVAQTNSKHAPFPSPLIARANGRFRLWDLDSVRNWHCYTFPKRQSLWDDAEARLAEFREESEHV